MAAAVLSKRKRLALPQQLGLINASMERSVSPLTAALVTAAGVMLTIALMSLPTARAARGLLDAAPIAAAGADPQAAEAAAAALAGGALQPGAGAAAAAERTQGFDASQAVASTTTVPADVASDQAALGAAQLPTAAGGEQPQPHSAVVAAGIAAADQFQPLPEEPAMSATGAAQDDAAAGAAAGEPGTVLQDAGAALAQQQAALAAEGAAAAAAADAAASGADPWLQQGAEAQHVVDPPVAEQDTAAAAGPVVPEEPLAPECSMSGVLQPDGSGCLCKLGAGGSTCGFSLSSIFGGNEVYNLSPLRAFDLQGWSPTADFYHRLLEDVQAQTVVEVGVWKGLSASHMAQYLKDRGHGVLVAVDTWLGAPEFWNEGPINNLDMERNLGLVNGYPSVYFSFLSNVVHLGLQEAIVPLPLPSKVASVVLRKKALEADLIHIDAAHEYASVKEDIHIWWPFVRPGGILLGDDMNWIGVKKAVDEFSVVCEVTVAVEGVKWWITRPDDAWFNDRPHLPSFCKIGEVGHYFGAM